MSNIIEAQTLYTYAGKTFSLEVDLTLATQEGDDTGTPINITGWTVALMVKTRNSDSDASAKLTKINTSHNDPTNGITGFTFTPVEMDAVPEGRYVYDIQTKDALGNESVTIQGILNVVSPTRTGHL